MTFTIRPLVWVEIRPNEFRADIPGGHYLLFKNRNEMWILELYFGNARHDSGAQGEFSWAFIRPGKAKERANEDWRERIAPALEPQPPCRWQEYFDTDRFSLKMPCVDKQAWTSPDGYCPGCGCRIKVIEAPERKAWGLSDHKPAKGGPQ